MPDTTATAWSPAIASVKIMDTDALLARARSTREEAAQQRARAAALRARLAASHTTARSKGDAAPGVAALQARLQAAEERAENMRQALVSNRRIGMACGVVMAVRGLTEQQAFEALRQASMRRNVKLRELAEEVIYTGDL